VSVSPLPPVPSPADWPALRRAHPGWRAVAEEICARHGVSASELAPARDGTNVVFTTERHVIKLYPPFWDAGAAAEWTILGHVEGRLGVATPAVVATGDLEGWPYLVMTRLAGAILADVWPGLAEPHRRSIARQLGELLARLHAVPTSGLASHSVLVERWRRLVTRPIEETVACHRGHGAPEAWLARLPAFLEQLPPLHPDAFTPVLVNGDVHWWHLLATERNGGWDLVGLFDFDDALLGWYEYDLAAPGLFFLAGQPEVLSDSLRGYGHGRLVSDAGLSRRLMAYALLNRYWGLDFMLQVGDPDRRCATFDDLERALFSFAPASTTTSGVY
jgi:hygromycin-B 7''-O-kinase